MGAFSGVFYGLRMFYFCFLTFKKSFYGNYKITFSEKFHKKHSFKKDSVKKEFNKMNFFKKSNLLGLLAMFSLFILNIFVFNNLLIFFLDKQHLMFDTPSFLKNFIFNNYNYFSIKILYIYTFYTLV